MSLGHRKAVYDSSGLCELNVGQTVTLRRGRFKGERAVIVALESQQSLKLRIRGVFIHMNPRSVDLAIV
jgi:hypothetical protein